MDRLASLNNSCEVYESEEYLESVQVKEEPTSEDDMPTDMSLDCILCAKKLLTITGLKAHVIAHHNYKSVKRKTGECPSPDSSAAKRQKHVCNVCKRSFVTSTDLKVHETCHDNFWCFACNAKFNTFKGVTRHRCKKKDDAVVTKPKTLTDILRERKAQKNEQLAQEPKELRVHCLRCTDTCFHDMAGYKIHKVLKHGETDAFCKSENKIEIEISNVVSTAEEQEGSEKTSVNVNKESDEAVKDTKTQVDYAKIENELESIFDIAVEKRQLQVTILENETDSRDKDQQEVDIQHRTVEEILSQESKADNSDGRHVKNEKQEYLSEQEEDCLEKNKQSVSTSSTTVETIKSCFIESESSLLTKIKSEPCSDQNIDALKCDSNNELDKSELLSVIDTIQNTEAIKEIFDIKVAEHIINQKSEPKESVDIKPIETHSEQFNEEVGEYEENLAENKNTTENQIQEESKIDNNKTNEEIQEPNIENKTNIAITIEEVQKQENKETKVNVQEQCDQNETNSNVTIEKAGSQDETTSIETRDQLEEDKQNEENDTKFNDEFDEVDKNNETDTTKTNKVELQDKENEKPVFNIDSDVRSDNTVNNQDEVDRSNIITITVEQNVLLKTNNCKQNGDRVEENDDNLEGAKHSDLLSKIVVIGEQFDKPI